MACNVVNKVTPLAKMDLNTGSSTSYTGKIHLALFILIITLMGDYFVGRNYTLHSYVFLRCIIDSSTHFSIAVVTWIIVTGFELKRTYILSLLLCGGISSLIDVDHFVSAQSFSITVSS